MQRQNFYKAFALLVAFCAMPPGAQAQAVARGRMYVVAQKSRAASDHNPGTANKPFKTISKAAVLASPGDTVLVHGGINREWVAPAHGGEEGRSITYMGAPKEQVIIKGSEIYSGTWQPVTGHSGVFSTKIPESFFTAGFNPFKIIFSKGRGGGRQGQVFITGKEIFEAKEPATTSLDEKKKPGREDPYGKDI